MLIQSVHLIVVFCAFFVSCFDFRASTFLYIDCVFRAVCEVTFNFSRCVFARITNLFFFLLAFFFSCVSQLHFALLFRCCAHFFCSFFLCFSLPLALIFMLYSWFADFMFPLLCLFPIGWHKSVHFLGIANYMWEIVRFGPKETTKLNMKNAM